MKEPTPPVREWMISIRAKTALIYIYICIYGILQCDIATDGLNLSKHLVTFGGK